MHGHTQGHPGGAHPAGGHDHSARKDQAAGHGMAIVGTQAIFLSHLPMFMLPHDYQVILEVAFKGGGSDPQRRYVQDRASNPDTSYTFAPNKSFVLPDLFPAGRDQPASLDGFRGDIFRGHFERGGVPIAQDVLVDVARVVRGTRFVKDAPRPTRLDYFLFGRGTELFLAHTVTAPPDFDQILAVTIGGAAVSDDELGRGVPIAFPGRADAAEARIQPGSKLSGVMQLAGQGRPVEVTAVSEPWLELRELVDEMRD